MLPRLITGGARRALPLAIAVGTLVPVVAGAVPAAAATPPKVVCTSAKAGLAATLTKDIKAALGSRKSTTAVALYDRRTGTHCTLDAGRRFDSASAVKVTVLGALLRQAKEANRKLTAREVSLTTAMITKSDNNATTALWKQLGLTRIKHFLTLAKMTQTTPGANGYWGLTQITAGDELKLMQLLTANNSVLGPDSRDYALRLMNKVIPAQRWGVPAGAPKGVSVHVKNGWLSRSTHAWRVHSVGAFTGGGRDYGIVVLTQDDSTMSYGIGTIEAVARTVHHDL
ncbi:serine hydrolase [Streptomyces sp. NBC_01190]|uniref:serine hydrolase n=1 Tax=Streptomyces sp. NBC_01190 TaxID=2903767 RepID=UPI00386E2883|nr:class A beta-lactamase-related serine hydrolase [Streptomyces sp. NBC_01190]